MTENQSTRGGKKRERFFDAYSENLASWFPDRPGLFLCPICLSHFDRAALCPDSELTIEHCIPRALGGRMETLTCRECNNSAGSNLDNQVLQRLRFEEFWKGGKTRGRFSVGNDQISVDVSLSPGPSERRFDIVLRSGQSDPAQQERLLESIKTQAGSPDLKMKLEGHCRFNPRKARVAMVRMGLLVMFRCFGYGYVLHPNAQQVRAQILDDSTDTIASAAILRLDELPEEHPFGVITAPSEMRCFVVFLPLKTEGGTQCFAVLLPGLDDDDASLYDRVRLSQTMASRVDFDFHWFDYDWTPIPSADDKWNAHQYWRECFGQSTNGT